MPKRLVFESPQINLGSRPASAAAASQRPSPAATACDPMPIVVGSPRSGTSLLAVMLDSHSALAVPPETAFLGPLQNLAEGSPGLREAFFSQISTDRFRYSNWADFELDKDEFWRRLEAIEPFSIAAGVRAFYALYAQHEGKSRWGDKTPTYALCMPFIERLLPEAHFIHIIRDPRDTVLSWRKSWFAPSQDLRVVARGWALHVNAARAASRLVRRYLELRYENLIVDPEAELMRVCEFLSLEFEPGMLDYAARGAARIAQLKSRHLTEQNVVIPDSLRAAMHANLIQPPRADRIENWRHEMTAEERQQVEGVLGPLLQELGYAQ
jgi:hypothetical protein